MNRQFTRVSRIAGDPPHFGMPARLLLIHPPFSPRTDQRYFFFFFLSPASRRKQPRKILGGRSRTRLCQWSMTRAPEGVAPPYGKRFAREKRGPESGKKNFWRKLSASPSLMDIFKYRSKWSVAITRIILLFRIEDSSKRKETRIKNRLFL